MLCVALKMKPFIKKGNLDIFNCVLLKSGHFATVKKPMIEETI